MGSYHYNRNSLLTRWQQEKLWSLCRERQVVVLRQFGDGVPLPNDSKLQRHLEREIDWYQMKEAKPGLDEMRAELRRVRRQTRKVVQMLRLNNALLSRREVVR